MKFTLSWLKDHLDTNASLEEISRVLSNIGLEVEKLENPGEKLEAFSVAEIVSASQHPNADKLKVCTVNTGKESLQIVCGAANARAGIKVVLAPIGSKIPSNGMEIKKAAIRGVESNGMLCSATELAIGDESNGIIELPQNMKIGEKFAKAANLDDPIFEIAITPNRGDCLGVRGIARDLASAGLGKLKKLEIKEIKGNYKSSIDVLIDDKKSCPVFIGRYIKNVKNTDSPEWMQNRLKAIGLRPISALVDITNYIAYEFARPLHVYDANKLNGNLSVRKARNGEKIATLNDKEYSLSGEISIVSDTKNPVAVAGVIGEKNSGCSEKTVDVFLEVALFEPSSVAVNGRTLLIDSDSRYRFERSIDSAFMIDAAHLTTKMIMDICGGEPSELVISGKIPEKERYIEFNSQKVKSLGGLEIANAKVSSILESLGFELKENKGAFTAKVPSWRNDISQENDLVEEVLRIYGYDNIPLQPTNNTLFAKSVLTAEQSQLSKIRKNLASRQMLEITSFSFMDSRKVSLFHDIDEDLKLLNPISSELDILRSTIIPNLLDSVKNNSNRGYENIALFEIGPVFINQENIQNTRISGIRSGLFLEKNAHENSRSVDFFDVKADVLSCLTSINPESINYTRNVPKWYHPGKSACMQLGKKLLAYAGEIHPQILKEFDIETNVAVFEIFAENLPVDKNKAKAKFDISNYQAVVRDFAFIIDDKITSSELIKTISVVNNDLITNINIFDVYKGKGIPENKKSIAFSVRIQPKDHTMSQAEIDDISKKIINEVQSKLGGTIRN